MWKSCAENGDAATGEGSFAEVYGKLLGKGQLFAGYFLDSRRSVLVALLKSRFHVFYFFSRNKSFSWEIGSEGNGELLENRWHFIVHNFPVFPHMFFTNYTP